MGKKVEITKEIIEKPGNLPWGTVADLSGHPIRGAVYFVPHPSGVPVHTLFQPVTTTQLSWFMDAVVPLSFPNPEKNTSWQQILGRGNLRDVLKALQKNGVEILHTPLLGTIQFRGKKENVIVNLAVLPDRSGYILYLTVPEEDHREREKTWGRMLKALCFPYLNGIRQDVWLVEPCLHNPMKADLPEYPRKMRFLIPVLTPFTLREIYEKLVGYTDVPLLNGFPSFVKMNSYRIVGNHVLTYIFFAQFHHRVPSKVESRFARKIERLARSKSLPINVWFLGTQKKRKAVLLAGNFGAVMHILTKTASEVLSGVFPVGVSVLDVLQVWTIAPIELPVGTSGGVSPKKFSYEDVIQHYIYTFYPIGYTRRKK